MDRRPVVRNGNGEGKLNFFRLIYGYMNFFYKFALIKLSL